MIMVQPASPPGKEPLPALPVIPKITLILVQQKTELQNREWGSCGSRHSFEEGKSEKYLVMKFPHLNHS